MNVNLNDILLQLGIGSKETVYLSLSPVVGLEIIKVDAVTKTITAYANRPLEYNESLREIADYGEFKTAVKELCEDLGISPHCNVVLNMPTVLFGSKDIPLILGDDAVSEVLISEAEQTYTFKRHDPLVAWMDSGANQSGETRKIFYSALQKDVVENIKKALSELGATLISVNTSISSMINALAFSGLTEEQMKENVTWNLMFVGLSGYSICSMQGTKIIDYYEEPLAMKSFEGVELYNTITSSAQLVLMNYPANFLYIVSDTDLVSAQLLADRLSGTDAVTGYLENNIYRKDEFIPTSLEILPDIAAKITLESIGAAVSNQVNLPIQMEFLGGGTTETAIEEDTHVKIRIGEKEYEIAPMTAAKIAVLLCAILMVPILFFLITVPMVNSKLQVKLNQLNEDAQKLETKIKAYSDEEAQMGAFDVKREINETLKNNRAKLMAYSALGETVPKGVWVTYFFTQKDGKMDIKGASTNVEDISMFYKNMKDSLINTKLRLYKLEMATNDIEDAVENSRQVYVFEITNMTEAELTSHSAAAQPQAVDGAKNQQKSNSSQGKDNSKSSAQKTKNQVPPGDNSIDNSDKPIIKKESNSVPKTLPFGLK